jgi:hypothetical protein
MSSVNTEISKSLEKLHIKNIYVTVTLLTVFAAQFSAVYVKHDAVKAYIINSGNVYCCGYN